MPEGDSIVKLADRLRPAVMGRTIIALDSFGCRGLSRLVDTQITSIETRGKHLLIVCSSGVGLRSHLGMHGRWRFLPDPAVSEGAPLSLPSVRARPTVAGISILMRFADGSALRGQRLAEAELIRIGDAPSARLARLGPDLCQSMRSEDWDRVVARAARRATQSDRPTVGEVLLDQWVAAGIGNVYKSEACFAVGIHPDRHAAELNAEQWTALYETARTQLRANLRLGPRRTTSRGLAVYRRLHKPCIRCGGRIERSYGGRTQRSSYWCRQCQPQS